MDPRNIAEYVCNLNNSRDNFPDFGNATSCLKILHDKLNLEKNAEQIAYAVDVVLDENHGIWIFLKEIKGQRPPKPFLEDVHSFIELICQQRKRLTEWQTRLLFYYCRDVIQSNTLQSEIKNLAYNLFSLVIGYGDFQFFTQNGSSLGKCVHHLYFNLEKSKPTEKRQIYELIGSVAENYPVVFHNDPNFITKVYRQISLQLPRLVEKQDGSGISEVEGMIKCVGGLLRYLSDNAETYVDKLYDCLKTVAERNSTKHVALRAVIQIIEEYFNVFAELIKKDYEFWYGVLDRTLISNNKDDSLAAKKALLEFYPHIAKLLQDRSETNKQILKFFLTRLHNDVLIEQQHKTEVALKSFTHFGAACQIQAETNLLNEIFTLTMSLLDKYCLSFNELDNDSIFNLSSILKSTSQFLRHLSGERCNEEYFQILANASVLSISAFAKAPEKMKSFISRPLLETIVNVANLNELYLDSFLESIIYPGIVMSCSSMTEGDLNCLKEACDSSSDFTCDDLLTFRDYLPIWKKMLGNLQNKNEDRQLIHSIDLEGKICDKVVECMLRIIEKLDISMKEGDQSNQDVECLILMEYDTVPCNGADLNIFINVVELFYELFYNWSNSEHKFHKWIPILIPKLIDLITYNDVKFGFYQMMAVVFKYVEDENDYNINEVKLFVLEELNHLSERPKTDSRACLRMVMSLPVNVVEELLLDVIPALKLAFERGSEDLSLASEALECLEKWYLKVDKDKFKPVLSEVIPYLKPFIQSKTFAGETVSMTNYEKNLMKKIYSKMESKSNRNRKYRQAYMQSEESELGSLQTKLIKFLGKIDTDMWINVFMPVIFVDREPADLLRFALYFENMKVDLFLDKFLPRLIDLACNSSDFNTRRDACEAFHSCVVVFLGENIGSVLEQHHPQYTTSLFKKIITTVFKLSTDENSTIYQIFAPLAIAMTHYYSRRQTRMNITDAFPEILLEVAGSKNDATRRKFIASLIKEYVRWSLKPTGEKKNARTVIEHIRLFCLQPSSFKKLGAAITFNSIYDEIRGIETLRDEFWIELLLHFIRNLSTSSSNDCNTSEVQVAIDKLVEIIRKYFHRFNKNVFFKKSRIPNWFDGKSLFDVQLWIFQQCLSSNELCRKKCMQILGKLLDENEGRPSLKKFIAQKALEKFKVKVETVPDLGAPHVVPERRVDDVISRLTIVSASLDCFLWIIETRFEHIEIFYKKDYKLRTWVKEFLESIVNKDLKSFISDTKILIPPGKKKQFDLLKEEMIYMILKLASVSVSLSDSFLGDQTSSSKNFQSVFIKCLFEPHLVLPHKKCKKELPSVLEKILKNLITRQSAKNIMSDIYHHEYWRKFSDVLDNPQRARTEHRSNPQVLSVLKNCQIEWPTSEMTDLQSTVRKIFYYIRQENTMKAIAPDTTIVSYFQDYLLFALKARYDNEFHWVAAYVFCSDRLTSVSGKATFSHGLHFFNTFRIPILEYLIDHQDEFINKCVDNLNLGSENTMKNPDTMKMLLAYLKFASTTKKKDCSAVLGHWIILKNSLVHSNIDLADLLKVLDFAIREMDVTRADNLTQVYDWLLDYLRSADTKIEIIHQILDELPVFMGFEFSNRYDNKLRDVLRDLRRQQIDSKIKSEGLMVYNKLLNALSRSGNRILFEIVVQIAVDKDASFQNNIPVALKNLMKKSPQPQLELIDIPWDIFKNSNNDTKLRIDSMELFLLPMVYLIQDECATVEEFYTNKIQFIYNDMQLKVENGSNAMSNLVSVMGAVILIDLYYKIMANPENSRIKAIICEEDDKRTLNSIFAKIAREILNNKITIHNENEDLVCKLKSHALNAFIGVLRTAIKSYKDAEKFGSPIFEKKNWLNVIKLEPPIKLTMTLEQIRTRSKEVIQKRRRINESVGSSFIATQYASMSSLAPEVSKYDANHFTVKSGHSEVFVDDIELFNEEREIDILNNHISMNALCNFVRFLEEKRYLIEDYDEEEPKLPKWMEKLRDVLISSVDRKEYNCVLYILKFITNCETAFGPFAKYWLTTLVTCLYKLNQMNYVVTDVVLMLLQWHDRAVPENRSAASNLFKMFTSKITAHQTASRNYLLEMMKAMIQIWHSYFDVPYTEISELIKSTNKDACTVGLNICEYFLQCFVFPYNEVNRTSTISLFLEKLTDQKFRWHNKQVATILGLILKTANKAGNGTLDSYYETQKATLVHRMKQLNNSRSIKTVDSFVLMEHFIVHYPPMLNEFSYHFLQRFNLLQGSYKRNCLRVLTNNATHVPDDAFSNLFSCNFESALKTNDHDLSQQALMLIKAFLSEDRIKVRIGDLVKIKDDLRRLSAHESSQCRKAAYSAADSIYEKYRNDGDDLAKDLVYTCKGILLAGLLDSDAELQEAQYKTWEKRSNLENKVDSRFLNIIRTMYHPEHEAHFVSYAVDFLLETCASTEDYNSAIFSRPLEPTSFLPYQIMSMKSRKSSFSPCFKNSIPYQLATLGTNSRNPGTLTIQMNRTPGSDVPTINVLNSASEVKSTKMYASGSHHPLKYISPVPTKSTTASESKPFDTLKRSVDRLKKRIIGNSQEASTHYAIRNAKLNEETCQILATQADRRDRKVDLKRDYRKGDYPDIEIKRSDLIKPLQALAKRDPIIAKLLFSNIFLNMVNKIKDKQDYLAKINEAFCAILKCTEQCGSICLETIFEIACSLPALLKLDIRSVVVASNMNNLLSLRALLLENSLIYEETDDCGPSASKRARIENSTENDSLWIHLAEVYKSLDRYDVVNGIFKEKIQNCYCQPLKKGLELETVGDWERAYEIYYEEVENFSQINDTSQDQRFILDAYYKCAAYLSKWDDMSGTIKQKFQTVDNILKHNWHKECTLPWYFLSQAYETAKHLYRPEEYDNDFRKQMLEMDQNNDLLFLDLLAEPSAILFFIYENQNKSQNLVKRSLDLILKEFNFSDSSLETFLKLQTLSEIETMLSVLNDDQSKVHFQDRICEILKIWERCEPNKDHSTWWDRRLVYRHRFAKKYIEYLDTSMDDTGLDLCQSLKNYEFLSKLQFCEKALDKKNYYLACKYTGDVEAETDTISNIPEEWKFMKSLNLCKMYTFRADKIKSKTQIQLAVDRMNEISEMDKKCEYKTRMAVSGLLKVVKKNFNVWGTDFVASLMENIPERFNERITLQEKIDLLIAENYKEVCEAAKRNQKFSDAQISSAYLALAKHSRDVSNESNSESTLCYDLQIASSILSAMKYNSKEAYQLFPVLLDLRSVENEEYQEQFINECKVVEEWKFLSWINQLLVYVYHGRVAMIGDLVVRMAQKYPNAFHFPFLLSQSVSENCEIKHGAVRNVVQKIKVALEPLKHIEELIKALNFVCAANDGIREGKCKTYRKRLEKSLDEDDADITCRKFYQVQNEINTYGGSFWPEIDFASDRNRLRSGLNEDKEYLKNKLATYNDDVNENVKNDQSPSLNSYSKILFDFIRTKNASVEIPGQYDGFYLPRVERHVKIFGFQSKVIEMTSLKRPVKITLLGDDAKEYSYLVKTNEDITQDQRIQQLFHIVNQALTSKFHLYSKHLTLNTFGVYPLKDDMGLIEWVEDSVPLRVFPNIGSNNEQKNRNEAKWAHLRRNYEEKEIMQKNICGRNYESYYLAVKNFSSDERKKDSMTRVFRKMVKEIEEDMYKKSLMLLTTTPHLFWRLRNQFMANYSSMSIAGWILGIGDRHLDNILVSLKSGTCIGIDFGLAFGTGTDALSVPELIPFRMTNQITSIMAPFGLTGLIRETMIDVLQTIRDNDYVLLATMPVFILDPSMDWCTTARKLFPEADQQNNRDDESYFKNKVKNVKLKLEGCHPAKITINELRVNQHIKRYCSHYEKMVTEVYGSEIPLDDVKLTTEEQVDCLLKIATHEGVLATSYSGLETWI